MQNAKPTFSKVGVNAHVSSSSSETLVLPVRNVLVSVGIDVFLRQSEVNNVDDLPLLRGLPSDEKVLGLHVSVDQMLRVDVLHPRNLTISEY